LNLIAARECHDVNPVDYLWDVLTRIATRPANRFAELLPGRWTATSAVRLHRRVLRRPGQPLQEVKKRGTDFDGMLQI